MLFEARRYAPTCDVTSFRAAVPWIEEDTEPIANKIDSHHGQEQRQTWKDHVSQRPLSRVRRGGLWRLRGGRFGLRRREHTVRLNASRLPLSISRYGGHFV